MQEAYTTTASILFDDDLILRIIVKKGAAIQLADTENHFRVAARLTSDKKTLVLIDARESFTVSADSRAYSAKHSPDHRIATAIITKSNAGRKMVNLFLSINKPSVPTRMFSNEEEAIEWLKGFK